MDRHIINASRHIKKSCKYRISKNKHIVYGSRLTFSKNRALLCYYPDEIYLKHFPSGHILKKPRISMWTGYYDSTGMDIYTGDVLSIRINCKAVHGIAILKEITEGDDVFTVFALKTFDEEYIAEKDFEPDETRHIHNAEYAAPFQKLRAEYEPGLRKIIDKTLNCRTEISETVYSLS